MLDTPNTLPSELNINSILLSDDAKTLNVVLTLDENSDNGTNLTMSLAVGENYLQQSLNITIDTEYINITEGSSIVTAAIPIEVISSAEGSIVEGYTKDIFDGIFVILVQDTVNSIIQYAEKPIINAYYLALALAHKILAISNSDTLEETNLTYLLLNASITYISLEKTEEALGAYQRVQALCASEPIEYFTTEISSCGVGTGCWIIGGVYVKF